MNCPKCGCPVPSRRKYCDNCGTDVSIYRKIIRLSNRYYNSGLEKAKVRDLSGAVSDLKKSLEINKRNIDARNLLGLVFYEMGETVAALSEWVISRNFSEQDNAAEMFLEQVQDNPSELDNVNQAIKKYNIALQAAQEQNDDLAILQLKKVIGLHGKFLRAIQLISLLLIKRGENNQARKYLEKALEIDVANTTTLKYLAEAERNLGLDAKRYHETGKGSESEEPEKERSHVFPSFASYREDKPNVMVFINLLLGVLIGIGVVYYLVVPTAKANIRTEFESQKVDYSSDLNAKQARITQQEKIIEQLEKQNADLRSELDGIDNSPVEIEVGRAVFDSYFLLEKEYKALKGRDYSDEDVVEFAMKLFKFDTSGLNNEYALAQIQAMKDDVYPSVSRTVYKDGKAKLESNAFEDAVGLLEAAVAFNPSSDAALYFLGKSYQALARYEEAVECYNKMLEVNPDSTLKEYIPQRLRECGVIN